MPGGDALWGCLWGCNLWGRCSAGGIGATAVRPRKCARRAAVSLGFGVVWLLFGWLGCDLGWLAVLAVFGRDLAWWGFGRGCALAGFGLVVFGWVQFGIDLVWLGFGFGVVWPGLDLFSFVYTNMLYFVWVRVSRESMQLHRRGWGINNSTCIGRVHHPWVRWDRGEPTRQTTPNKEAGLEQVAQPDTYFDTKRTPPNTHKLSKARP